MRIAEGVDVRLGIFDIETIVGMFDVGVYDPDTKEWYEFEISAYHNDLYKFVKFYTDNKLFDYWVSFNGIGFDHQVLQYIVDQSQNWADLSGVEIAAKIGAFGSKVIDDQNYDIQPPYRENQFSVKPLDVFRIHHMDNAAKRTSLKWCEYMFNMDVEEMPIHFSQSVISPEERLDVISYRRHDVLATLALVYLTLGDMTSLKKLLKDEFGIVTSLDELKDYEGKNKIQDRYDVIAETAMECLNWSDVKIGEEWNKLNYIKEENIKDVYSIYEKKPKYPYGKRFKDYFPSTMHFTTKPFIDFMEKLGETRVLASEQEFPLTVGKTTHVVAKGGVHSNEKNRIVKPPAGYLLIDADVGGQYPNFIIKELVHAPHLKNTIISIAQTNVRKRKKYKKLYQELKAEGKAVEARPYNGLQEMLKLCNNGGLFGKLGQEGSFLHYPEGLLKVCLGNEVEILMLIEALEFGGFSVISSNTDGATTLVKEDRLKEYYDICNEWERRVGNTEDGKLEYTDYACMWQDAVNSYLAQKTDGSIKKKGKFLTQFEMNKNKSQRIIALALEAYYINDISPVDFITKHDEIFDFCTAKKAFGDMHYEELAEETIVHKKLIRYYISTDGNVIKKRGLNKEGNPMDNYCEAPPSEFPWMDVPKMKYFNRYKKMSMADYNVDYSFYILKTLQRIDKISKTKMAKNYADTFKAEQFSLF